MKSKLVYNVVLERNGKIEKYNIFDHGGFIEDLRKLKDETDIDSFKEKLDHILKYYFWARAEYEIILTDWPTMITKDVLEKGLKDFEERERYRVCINLPVSVKVDIYDQSTLNYDLFINYIWANLSEL